MHDRHTGKTEVENAFLHMDDKDHLKDNSAKGILARSMKAEGDGFPKRRRLKTLIGYLEHRGASQEVMDALVECWEEYENYERENHRTKTGSGS